MASEAFQQRIAGLRKQVEAELSRSIRSCPWPQSLRSAVDYSLMAGGKRLRPVLVLLANEVCGGRLEDAWPAACAIEMIHTYSLIHDDLPAMDNDDYRRGRLTNHKVYGEALAILAGDALLTLAFEKLSETELGVDVQADLMRVLAVAAGGGGMVGGQVLDLEAERGPFPTSAEPSLSPATGSDESGQAAENTRNGGCSDAQVAVGTEGQNLPFGEQSEGRTGKKNEIVRNVSSRIAVANVEELNRIHRMKTGALIAASLEMGATSARATREQRNQLVHYGHCIGLAFQIADDVLDVTGDAVKLGKTPGRDVDLGKLTYPALLGLDSSRQKATELVQEACNALKCFGEQGHWLEELARFIVERDH
jgi:geranylgeranyl diphosphate synthase type II